MTFDRKLNLTVNSNRIESIRKKNHRIDWEKAGYIWYGILIGLLLSFFINIIYFYFIMKN